MTTKKRKTLLVSVAASVALIFAVVASCKMAPFIWVPLTREGAAASLPYMFLALLSSCWLLWIKIKVLRSVRLSKRVILNERRLHQIHRFVLLKGEDRDYTLEEILESMTEPERDAVNAALEMGEVSTVIKDGHMEILCSTPVPAKPRGHLSLAATSFVLLLLPKDDEENGVGDIRERYNRQYTLYGERHARLWYYKQIISLMWPKIKDVLGIVGMVYKIFK